MFELAFHLRSSSASSSFCVRWAATVLYLYFIFSQWHLRSPNCSRLVSSLQFPLFTIHPKIDVMHLHFSGIKFINECHRFTNWITEIVYTEQSKLSFLSFSLTFNILDSSQRQSRQEEKRKKKNLRLEFVNFDCDIVVYFANDWNLWLLMNAKRNKFFFVNSSVAAAPLRFSAIAFHLFDLVWPGLFWIIW